MADTNPAKQRFLDWDVDHQEPLDCPMCGAQKSFDINPNNPAEGYCHKEETIWTVKPGKPLAEIKATVEYAAMKLDVIQRHEIFWKYCTALDNGDMEGLQDALRYAELDAELDQQIARLHRNLETGLPERPTLPSVAGRFLDRCLNVDNEQAAWVAYNRLWRHKTFFEEIGDLPMLKRVVHLVIDGFFQAKLKPSYPIRDAYLTFLLRWLGFTVYENCPDCRHTISAHGDNGCNQGDCGCSRPKYGFFHYIVWDIAKKGTDETVISELKG